MRKIAFLFDGQGAFKPGIGRELYNRYKKAKEIIDKSCDLLNYDLKKYLWGEEASKTPSFTSIAQPAISVVSLAYAEILKEMGVWGAVSLGHSLGEATAVIYCEGTNFDDGIRIIKKRGEVMEKGGKEGTMMAVMGMDIKLLEAECERVSSEINEPVVIANINAPNQIVVSGSKEGIKIIAQFASQNKGRGILLDVGGAWHSPYLKEAAAEFGQFLDTIEFRDAQRDFYSVVEQKVIITGSEIKNALKRQMLSQVNWVRAIENIKDSGYEFFLEIGPSKILKDLVAKIAPEIKVDSTALYTEMEQLVKNL
ncbi:MAG: ACP S-malonyltransferase [candidate division WOR-3 bacterium]